MGKLLAIAIIFRLKRNQAAWYPNSVGIRVEYPYQYLGTIKKTGKLSIPLRLPGQGVAGLARYIGMMRMAVVLPSVTTITRLFLK